MKRLELCPYKSSNSGQCTHKGCKISRKQLRFCGHKNHYNCPLFIDWVRKARKAKIEGRKSVRSGMEDIDGKS